MPRQYKLIPITDLDKSTQLQVLDIRNEGFIRQWMFTEDVISADDHLSWINGLETDNSQICFVIVDADIHPFGSVNLKKINENHKTAELGFYRTQNLGEKGLITESLKVLIEYSFQVLGLEKIYSEIFEGNIKSINIHKKLLFVEEGFLRSHITKNGVRIGVHLFGLLKSEWENGKYDVNTKDDIYISLEKDTA